MKPSKQTPFPIHLEIETTNVCQLACPFCPHHKMKREKGMMLIETLEQILDQAKGMGVKTCYMHMIGEPLIHPAIIPMIDLVNSHGIWTSISTNAMLLDEKMTQRLIDSKLDELTLALDSLKPEVYRKLRVKGDFDLVIKNIDHFIERRIAVGRGPRVELQVIVMNENVDEIPSFRSKYIPMMDQINVGISDEKRKSWLRVKGFSTFAGQVPDMSPEPSEPLRFRCKKLWQSMAVHWNGDLSLCCRDYDSAQIVGNIRTNKIEDIWNGKDYDRLRDLHRNEEWGGDKRLDLCSNC